MRYSLLLHYPEMSAEELGAEALAEGMKAFDDYAKALDAAGVLGSAEVLMPSAATTTISLATGELVVQDARSPTPRSNSGARSLSMSPIWMPPWPGRGKRPRCATGMSRSARRRRASSTASGRAARRSDAR